MKDGVLIRAYAHQNVLILRGIDSVDRTFQWDVVPRMSRRHALLMLACCLVPVAGIAALVLFRVPLNAALWLVFALACPLIHVLGMRAMGAQSSLPSVGGSCPRSGWPFEHSPAPGG